MIRGNELRLGLGIEGVNSDSQLTMNDSSTIIMAAISILSVLRNAPCSELHITLLAQEVERLAGNNTTRQMTSYGFSNKAPVPALSPSESVTPEYIVCLEDGARVKSLKRYIRRFGLTPEQYRKRWGLPVDYPMIAPALSERRSAIARRVKPHLGRKFASVSE